jgi:hypothetical protein
LRFFEAVPHLGTAIFLRAASLRVALEMPQDRRAGPALQARSLLGGQLKQVNSQSNFTAPTITAKT